MNALVETRPDFMFLPQVPPADGASGDRRPPHAQQAVPGAAAEADLSPHRLTIAGLVSRTSQFSIDELQLEFPEHEVTTQAGSETAAQPNHTRWQGCRLNDVLEFVGVCHRGAYLEFVGADGSDSEGGAGKPRVGLIPVDRLQSHPPLLGWAADGKPLTAAQGAPLVALIPEGNGYRCIGGLHRINLLLHAPAWAQATPTQ